MIDSGSQSGTSAPRVLLSMMMSEDGFVAGPEGQLDWVQWGPEMDVAALNLLDRADIFIAGHNAFRDMAAYWPEVAESSEASAEERAYARKLCAMPRAVIGRPDAAPIWDERATLAPDSLRGAVDALMREFGTVIAFGGTRAAQSLLAQDIVEVLCLFVSPVSIATGTRLFASEMEMHGRFDIVATQELAQGGSLRTLVARHR